MGRSSRAGAGRVKMREETELLPAPSEQKEVPHRMGHFSAFENGVEPL
jgi:hypothetical protein